jgi:hypothetical protein
MSSATLSSRIPGDKDVMFIVGVILVRLHYEVIVCLNISAS